MLGGNVLGLNQHGHQGTVWCQPIEVQFGLPALGPVHASSVQLSDVPGPGEEGPTIAELAKLEALVKGDAYRRQRATIDNAKGNRKAAFEVGS